jgi:hypothetical protein
MSYLAKPNEQPHFDGSDMLMMHDMFRREFALMPGLVGGVAAGDHDRAQIIGDHIEGVSTVLHHHHIGEDGNIWPLLLDRCGESAAPLVGLMEDQHQRVATLVGEVEHAIVILPAEIRTVIKQLAASTFADHSQRVHGSATPPRGTEL